MKKILKALALCAAQDATRGVLCTIHKETVTDGILFVATDGHLVGIAHLTGEKDQHDFYTALAEETGADVEFLKTTPSYNIAPDVKSRKMLGGNTFIDSPYPSWRKVMPTNFKNPAEPEFFPFFAVDIFTRIGKVAKAAGFPQYSGVPRGWNTSISLTKMFSFGCFDLYAMPLRVLETAKEHPAFDTNLPEEA